MRLLVDSNVYRFPAVSTFYHAEDELVMWGETLLAFRKYSLGFDPPKSPEVAAEIPYVPALGQDAKQHGIEFLTYQLLEFESLLIRSSLDWARRSISEIFDVKRIRFRYEYNGTVIGAGADLRTNIRRFIERVDHPRLKELVATFGKRNSQDAFHFFVCEEEKIDGFVTLDLKLRRKFDSIRGMLNSPVEILRPSEVCQRYGIKPVGQNWFAETDIFCNDTIQLFSRRATSRYRFMYRCYRVAIWLRDRFGVQVRFVIPGYRDGIVE